jgi:hypothetical protein
MKRRRETSKSHIALLLYINLNIRDSLFFFFSLYFIRVLDVYVYNRKRRRKYIKITSFSFLRFLLPFSRKFDKA